MSSDPLNPATSLLVRDRVRRAQTLSMSPAERLAAMQRLLARSRALLERNPDGLAHFRARNFAARAIGRHATMDADDS
jgi:hypothetical protein